MGRGSCLVAFAAAVIALPTVQARSEPTQSDWRQQDAVGAVAANAHPVHATDRDAKGCLGTQYPWMSCDAISAQADLEQARQSLRQANQSARQSDLFRTEVLISFLTMIAAIAAAAFAAKAARAAGATVDAFTEVEQADVFVTLESFALSNVFVRFNIIANNLGRSSALVQGFGITWQATPDLSALGGFVADSSPHIIPPGGRVVLQADVIRQIEDLREESFMWLLLKTQSPLRGELRIRACYNIFDAPTHPHKSGYRTIRLDHIDGQSRTIKTFQLGKGSNGSARLWRRAWNAVRILVISEAAKS